MRNGMFKFGGLLALLLCLGNGPAAAQLLDLPGTAGSDAPAVLNITLPDPLTPESINALVSRLSDNDVRAMLLERLDAVSQSPDKATGSQFYNTLALMSEASDKVVATVAFNIVNIDDFLTAQGNVFKRFSIWLGSKGTKHVMFWAVLAVVLGLAAERAMHWMLFQGRASQPSPVVPDNFLSTLRRAGRRMGYELLSALVFAVVATVTLQFSTLQEAKPLLRLMLFWLIVMPRFSVALLRFFFKPAIGEARLLSVDDRSANILFWNFVSMTYFIGFALLISTVNQRMGGPPDAQPFAFWFWFNVIFFGWLAILFGVMREGWRSIMLGGRDSVTPFDARSIRAYPWLAVTAVLATWVFCVAVIVMNAGDILAGGRHFISLAIILIAPLLDTLIHAILRHFTSPMRGEGEVARKAYGATFKAYIRIGRVLVFGTVLLVSARLWHITPTSVAMASAGVGEQLAATLVQVGLIAVIGYLTWEVVRLLINTRLANELTSEGDVAPTEHGEGQGGTPTTRLGTILPPISKALQVVILTLTVLTILANLGVDVTALLAGAGIVGIAVGFGSQKLVGDVISGMFFLIDDAFRLNEYIDVGGAVGTVERISLRSIRLRASKGPVLIIPYSEIKTVTNFGRDWGIMKLKFTVPFDTDVEQVRKLFKKIGQEMLEDPALGPGFIEPFKSQGVYAFNDYGIVVRGKFTHKPGAQFEIRKKVFTRVKEEFDKAGIEFARREVKVDLGDYREELAEEEALKISAAAVEHIAQSDRAAAAGAKKVETDDR
jgi:small-conductance mechanosensitive channel